LHREPLPQSKRRPRSLRLPDRASTCASRSGCVKLLLRTLRVDDAADMPG